VKALRRLTVRLALPAPLEPLSDLVMNLRWSWHPASLDLFRDVDPQTWDEVRQDPVRLLGEVSPQRLAALAEDEEFLGRLRAAHDDLQDYLTRPRWYQSLDASHGTPPRSIAYFSPEFGITEVLPQYSGGLGILAGDHLKAASDLGVPVLGVGLLYRAGYFKQLLNAEGWQQERYPPLDPHGLPLTLVTGTDGAPLVITVELPGRTLHAHVWRAQVGRVPLLLLDSDVELNAEAERQVTDRLYGGGTDHRLHQELLLGVGGVRAIRAWCALTGEPAPEVFHTNEGHAGFLGVERVRELVEQGLTYDEAREAVRAGTVFTTHTPVPAGIDRFPRDLIARYFSDLPQLPVGRILELGSEEDPDVFNMAHMGLRMAQRRNGVARLHGIVSREMFSGLWPGFDAAEVPITSVTNGVHAPTWVAREVFELAERGIGRQIVEEAQGWEAIEQISAADIWATRRVLREHLVVDVRRRLRESWLQRGAPAAELGWIDTVFDPDVLTMGFARRVPSYKRLTLMLRDPDRLRALLLDEHRPVQLVIAGKSHPADDGGKQLIQDMVRFSDDPEVRHRIVFLPDYDIGMARHLYAGCDVWLNNPLRPLEACGTSGMKSALNGGLNLSIRDGWWDEMYDGENGWAIPTADGVDDPDRRDDLEAAAFYELVEKQVRTRFYDRAAEGDEAGIPHRWVDMVRHTLESLGPKVLASRMVRDYVHQLYTPAAEASRALAQDSFGPARALAAWRADVVHRWPELRVVHAETGGAADPPQVGTVLDVRAIVDLAGLRPEDVTVQAVYGRVDEVDRLQSPQHRELETTGTTDEGLHRFEGNIPLERAGSFGYTVRVLPHHPSLPGDADLGLMTTA
jgi:glycogen phosphorylase